MTQNDKQLQSLVDTISATAKYNQVSPDLITAIGRYELTIRPSWKEAVKATKSKLHQVAGAYQGTKINYKQALTMLQEKSSSPTEFREACRQIMRWHLSTRERLPILKEFYNVIFGDTPDIRSIIDIACGLNPLARSWMPFSEQVEYMAYDIYADSISFIGDFMDIAGIKGRAEVRDVLHHPPRQQVDLALILKTVPCLEQLSKDATYTLLDAVQASKLLISYPVTSIGGRRKGMITNYDTQFTSIAARYHWSFTRFEFSTELAFLVQT